MRIPDATIANPPDADNDAELHELNRAIRAQRRDEQKMTFLCYYLYSIPISALLDHYELSRAGLKSRIERFRARVIIGQRALLAGRYLDENVIQIATHRREAIQHARAFNPLVAPANPEVAAISADFC
jgi:hypothetical protein